MTHIRKCAACWRKLIQSMIEREMLHTVALMIVFVPPLFFLITNLFAKAVVTQLGIEPLPIWMWLVSSLYLFLVFPYAFMSAIKYCKSAKNELSTKEENKK